METSDSAQDRVVFKSIRFDPALAERLADFVHAAKKQGKASQDAVVQRAVAEYLDHFTGESDLDIVAVILAEGGSYAEQIRDMIAAKKLRLPKGTHVTTASQEAPNAFQSRIARKKRAG